MGLSKLADSFDMAVSISKAIKFLDDHALIIWASFPNLSCVGVTYLWKINAQLVEFSLLKYINTLKSV